MEVDWDEAEFIQELIDTGRITGAVAGIAAQAIDPNAHELSTAQRAVFDRAVREPWLNHRCKYGCEIPSSELSCAMDNGWLCSWQARMLSKDE